MREVLDTISNVLEERVYIFTIVSLVSFTILYYLMLYNVSQKSLEIFIQMNGLNYTFLSLILNVVIAVLIGTFVTLLNYRMESKNGIIGNIGALIGGFSAGCPTCGAVLFSLIGFPLVLMSLPFRGLELKVLSIMILAVSVYLMSLKVCNTCRIKRR